MAHLQSGSEVPHLTAQGMYLSGCVLYMSAMDSLVSRVSGQTLQNYGISKCKIVEFFLQFSVIILCNKHFFVGLKLAIINGL